MADWTELDTNGLLPGEPFTSAKALALFENPGAMAEGASNAPKVVSEALNMLVGAGLGTQTFTNVGRIEKVLIQSITFSTGSASTAVAIEYQTSTNNGATFATAIDLPDTIVTGPGSIPANNILTLTSSMNAFRLQIRLQGAGATGTISCAVLGVSGVSP